jgi:hypothetical protein
LKIIPPCFIRNPSQLTRSLAAAAPDALPSLAIPRALVDPQGCHQWVLPFLGAANLSPHLECRRRAIAPALMRAHSHPSAHLLAEHSKDCSLYRNGFASNFSNLKRAAFVFFMKLKKADKKSKAVALAARQAVVDSWPRPYLLLLRKPENQISAVRAYDAALASSSVPECSTTAWGRKITGLRKFGFPVSRFPKSTGRVQRT